MNFFSSRSALLALLALAPLFAFAATTPGEQDLIRDRQDRLLEEQRRRLEDLKDLPGKQAEPVAPSAPADTRCFTINRIELKGADSLSSTERDALIKPYLGQCLGVAQLNELLKVITDHYIEKGLVTTRAYLPQQDLSNGDLQVLVIEGKLEKLRSATDSGLSDRELAMTFPGREGEMVNLREIEQMVDQLNRLPSNQAQMELTPGQAVGGSDVVVKNTAQKPWRANLTRTNEGQRSTGEQQWNAGLEWDNPLGLADQFSFRGGHDAISDRQKASRNATLSYSLPWGWWTFSYLYSTSEYRSVAQASNIDFKQDGDSQNHQFRAERVIHRDALSKTSLNAGLAYLRTNNYVEDSKLALSSNRITEAQFGINHGRRIGSAFLNIDLGMQQGIGALDAQGSHDPGPGEADSRYRKYTGTVSYLHPFQLWGEKLSFTSLATGQRSEDVLFSPQRQSLGGSSSVRGYKDQFLSGDSGGYWRNEVRLTRPVTFDWLRPVFAEYGVAAGYDQGVIRGDRYNGDQYGRLSSNSFELFTRGQHVAASVTFAHSLERPDVIERESPIYLRVDFFL
ncbi:ShlB family hemolysin secretion/activation protein [Pseudomonas floridensis]|uniref:ShlB family hemolysin secretion/activation protein n=1 Tax=Pseudomonas floridensis TaxID=1958950 RepID=A0A1X0N625_9PSED|nr:ShlB/FhaC/HecB family hemolysin secretion/activation protein [Pseudomonas floridensis]ORC58936.1 ShlB family hemolysin secretion/activation protein [Pseudomonas floridensis]